LTDSGNFSQGARTPGTERDIASVFTAGGGRVNSEGKDELSISDLSSTPLHNTVVHILKVKVSNYYLTLITWIRCDKFFSTSRIKQINVLETLFSNAPFSFEI
jgi:hypothetical protein